MGMTTAYRHEAMPYAGDDEFVAMASSFLGGGVRDGEPGLLITGGARLTGTRDALGDLAGEVTFVDVDEVGHNPARAFAALHEFVAADPGRRVRAIDEPLPANRAAAVWAEAEFHELLLGTRACRDWNLWLGCPYDTAALADTQVRAMRSSHPSDGRDMGPVVSARFREPLSPRPRDAQTFPIDGRDLAVVRAVVRTAARMAGVCEQRCEDFVCAVNEVVTNSVRHGRGPADFALWSEDGALVCEVHDQGQIRDPLAGRRPPALGKSSGRGLWLANHLCDLVQIRGPESGTCVRMHIGCH